MGWPGSLLPVMKGPKSPNCDYVVDPRKPNERTHTGELTTTCLVLRSRFRTHIFSFLMASSISFSRFKRFLDGRDFVAVHVRTRWAESPGHNLCVISSLNTMFLALR
jgi:hypothetical protein